jgi:hypothetical protein
MFYRSIPFWKPGTPLTLNRTDYTGRNIVGPYSVGRFQGGKAWYVWGLREGVSARVLCRAYREGFKLKRDALQAMSKISEAAQ